MIWGLPNILRRLRRSRPPSRGQLLRGAIRRAPSRAASPEDERVDLADLYGPGAELANMLRRKRIVLRDGTPYEESGADENDWRL
jgi:hypothetical protein